LSDRSERFFVWVWRVNGLIVLVAAVAIVALVAALSMPGALWDAPDGPEQQLVNVAGADLRADKLHLTQFRDVPGTRFLYASLADQIDWEDYGSIRSGPPPSSRNVLFFDTDTKAVHWLFPTHDQHIRSHVFLYDPPSRDEWDDDDAKGERRTVALLIETEPRAAGEKDAPPPPRSIAIAAPDGRDLATIVPACQGLLGQHQITNRSAFVFYVADGAARVIELDALERSVRSDALLAEPEAKD
jgi:hypothetical protein